MQERIPTKVRAPAKADGCARALKGSRSCCDQTQPPVPRGTDGATWGTTSKNTPADNLSPRIANAVAKLSNPQGVATTKSKSRGNLSRPPLCNPNATPAPGKGERIGKPVPKAGRRIPHLVADNLTPKGPSPAGVIPRKEVPNRVLVLNQDRTPAMPCTPAKARRLLSVGKAAVLRFQPFTVILKYNTQGKQPLPLKTDPGANTDGSALTLKAKTGWKVSWAAELAHRTDIKHALLQRKAQRRGRRQRKTRYRAARFHNRTRPKGWLAPSVKNRVLRCATWTQRLIRWTPITQLVIEHVRFDTQLMANAEVSGIEYQPGTLQGYEGREYLLEKWGRKCACCQRGDRPLTIEHIIPRIRNGSNRIPNLTLACKPCNQDKDNRTATEYGFPHLQPSTLGLQAAAITNTIRWQLVEALKTTELPIEYGSGGRTKYNRTQQNYLKTHWIDAACAGPSGAAVQLDPHQQVLRISALARNHRRMVRPDTFGVPKGQPKGPSTVKGVRTADLVKAVVTTGTKRGSWYGRVALRATGKFKVGQRDAMPVRCLAKLQHNDGYNYAPITSTFLPGLKARVSSAIF